MNHIPSYPSVYALGHKAISEIFLDEVLVEEKIDGSSFSFGLLNGEFSCRSKGKDLIPSAPEKMFTLGVENAMRLDLHPDWTYRCEYLSKPKHNTLNYKRVPVLNLMVYDIQTGPETYLSYEDKLAECQRIGLECVPMFYRGKLDSYEQFKDLLQRESVLGGCMVEGVVVKNYSRFTADKKAMIGKYVSEEFKEKHGVEWKKSNPTAQDICQFIIGTYKTQARWMKAVQHLKEAGVLEGSPKDIGPLMQEVPADTEKEYSAEMGSILFKHFWPQIRRGVVQGLPEWYKEQLAKEAFK